MNGEIYENQFAAFLAPAPDLLSAESRENRAHNLGILGWVIGEVSDGSFDCRFHDFRSKGLVAENGRRSA